MGDPNDAEIEKFMKEITQVQRDSELKRIIGAFKLDPLHIMNLELHATSSEVTKQFRKLSILVHPDKYPVGRRKQAQDAFAKLQQARKDLLDEEKRKLLNDVYQTAQRKIADRHRAKKRKVGKDVDSTEPVITKIMEIEIRAEVKQLLIDQEWRRRQMLKMTSKLEGEAAKEAETRRSEREEREKTEQDWEGKRDQRISGWRNFNKSMKKKSKKKRKRIPGMASSSSGLVADSDKAYIKRVRTD
eukprot:392392_1